MNQKSFLRGRKNKSKILFVVKRKRDILSGKKEDSTVSERVERDGLITRGMSVREKRRHNVDPPNTRNKKKEGQRGAYS